MRRSDELGKIDGSTQRLQLGRLEQGDAGTLTLDGTGRRLFVQRSERPSIQILQRGRQAGWVVRRFSSSRVFNRQLEAQDSEPHIFLRKAKRLTWKQHEG